MICQICGGQLEKITTHLPFKAGDECIVTARDLSVLPWRGCRA